MNRVSQALRTFRPWLRRHRRVQQTIRSLSERAGRIHVAAAQRASALIRPAPRQITFAITAQCNLRCVGCRYGRDFMVGSQLSLDTVREALDDAHAAGVATARFFGGEPLLHPDLAKMIAHTRGLGMDPYITTNGVLLGERIEPLYDAGLRWLTIGFYGQRDQYARYTQCAGQFDRLVDGLTSIRRRYGSDVSIQLNFMLYRDVGTLGDLCAAWEMAQRFDLHLSIDPVSETIPFFNTDNEALHFVAEDEPALREISAQLIEWKRQKPSRMPQSELTFRALPDLLLRRSAVKIPCDAYQMLWVGANGVVQLCDSHFELGNLNDQPLREILFGSTHRDACRAGFLLDCPDCNCKIDSRIRKHSASVRKYGGRS